MKIRHNQTKRYERFTLVEIMVVVVILGILAATIIPQFMGTTHDAKVERGQRRTSPNWNRPLERFYVHMDRYPTTEEGLKVLVDAPHGDATKNGAALTSSNCAMIPGAILINIVFPGRIIRPVSTSGRGRRR